MSTLGYQYVSQYLASRWKITDTCGVNNLHGMPAIFGSLLSILLTRTATPEMYNQFNSAGGNPSKFSYHEIFPRPDTVEKEVEFWGEEGWTPTKQAKSQAEAMAVTVALAVAGGIVTGSIMKLVVGLSPPPSNNPKSKQDIEEMELEDAKALPK